LQALIWYIENNIKFLTDDKLHFGCNWDNSYSFKDSWFNLLEKNEFKLLKEKDLNKLLYIIVNA